jgi:NAD(P)-dependent dehydrogenase (short-subunit alcohol dehydrogenase family)
MAVADVSGKSIAELNSLKGRVAVVTGGAQGLGRAMVNRLAEAGASVLILDLMSDKAEAAAREVSEATGSQVIAASVDVSDETSVAAAADRAVAELGGLDIWVNNAGLYPNVPLLDVDVRDWDQVMA